MAVSSYNFVLHLFHTNVLTLFRLDFKIFFGQFKGHSHYCVFRVRLRQMVAFPQGDRKFPISALTQPTAENARGKRRPLRLV